jgi:hypothetical protein
MQQPDRERLSPQVRAAVDASMQRYRLEESAAPAKARPSAHVWILVWAVAALAVVEIGVMLIMSGQPWIDPSEPHPAVVVTPSVTPGPCPSGGVRC